MFHRIKVYSGFLLCLVPAPLSAAAVGTAHALIASASESARSNGEKQETVDDEAAADASSPRASHRDPEPLTLTGVLGLLLLIAAIGGLSWWIMRPMLGASEQEDGEQSGAATA